MHWIDFAIFIVIVGSGIYGAVRGLIVEVASIAGAFVGLAIAHENYLTATDFLSLFLHQDKHLAVIAYFLVFALVWTIIILLAQIARAAIRLTPFGMIDWLGGLIVGLVIGIVLVQVLLLLGTRSQDPSLVTSIHSSQLARVLVHHAPAISNLVPSRIMPGSPS